MIDIEWNLKLLRENARHEREMRLLQAERLDAHDQSLEHVTTALEAVGKRFQEIAIQQAKTETVVAEVAAMQKETAAMMQNLVQILTREHSNGKGKPDAE